MAKYHRFSCPICGKMNTYLTVAVIGLEELYCSVDTEEEHKFKVPERRIDNLIEILKKNKRESDE